MSVTQRSQRGTDRDEAQPRLDLERLDTGDWRSDRLQSLEHALSTQRVLERSDLLAALSEAIRNGIATGRAAVAIFVDLNHFADINAAWGLQTGDAALTAAAHRIADFAAERFPSAEAAGPRVGRLDADHFLLIVEASDSFGALAREVAELVRMLAQPVPLGSGAPIGLSARAAIVHIPEHARSVTSVLGRGFRSLNGAARERADGVAVSESDAAAASTIMLERDLAAALATDELFLALQPKVEIATGAIVGAEALARWRHPTHGPISPSVFVGLAEKSGLIFDLGLRILKDACRASQLLALGGKPIGVAVNVSAHQLAHPDFLPRFLATIDQEGVEPQSIEIELTETAAMAGGERVLQSLQSIRRCGIRVAIDDFGTGFSNLAALAALPADTLKIDRSLVIGAEKGEKPRALLDIAIELGRTLGLETLAEGVETKAQLDYVAQRGCALVQGYFTGRPVLVEEFRDRYCAS